MAESIPTSELGRNGPKVSRLGFGAMGFAGFYSTRKSDEEIFSVLDAAYSLGVRHWDTADAYTDNEDILGRWFAANPGKRQNIFLATKFGITADEKGAYVVRNDPDYIRQACDRSLSRIGIDSIDLYYAHRIRNDTPIEKTVEVMAELVSKDKIKHIGLSECSAETLRRAYKIHPITVVQMEYSPFELSIEKKETNLLSTARELGVAIVAYSPLGRGMLTGTIKSPADLPENDVRRGFPRYSPENFDKNLKLVDGFERVADAKNCTTTQLALAWLLAQGPDIFPIPGTTRVDRLRKNAGAAYVRLTDAELKELRELVDNAEVEGDRFDHVTFQNYEELSFTDTVPL
ncbi:putative aldo-keto reductase [Rhizodiscina lignyota]|uniref:Aldo-keto reductase n=1 Tax=Rhizodiscina lignyota TaxID=1504668 RepID=A0A9P4M5V5_9PEZI|nr:putative aldo-keto reductase [Rhizodiscina lignyota]